MTFCVSMKGTVSTPTRISAATVFLLLVGCAGAPSASHVASNWDEAGLCAASLDEVTASLAGANAVDCGITIEGLGETTHSRTMDCARRTSTHRALRFGVAWFGIDSGTCHVVVRTEAGRLFRLSYAYDVSPTPTERVLGVERCESLAFKPATDAAFELGGCVADEGALQRLLALHRQLQR